MCEVLFYKQLQVKWMQQLDLRQSSQGSQVKSFEWEKYPKNNRKRKCFYTNNVDVDVMVQIIV